MGVRREQLGYLMCFDTTANVLLQPRLRKLEQTLTFTEPLFCHYVQCSAHQTSTTGLATLMIMASLGMKLTKLQACRTAAAACGH